jgi:two-component system NtrC family response regulator
MAQILIIDDEAFIRDILSSRVFRLGHEALEAENLYVARDILARHPVDLVFLDVNLPDGSGLAALPEIKSSPSAPEVIIVTAVGTEDGAALAIQNGAWDYITKPFRKEDIILLIRRSLEYRQAHMAAGNTAVLDTSDIVGSSVALRKSISQVARSAANTANVFIQGETGTGKELFARAIHDNCRLTPGNYVVVDCAAMPEALTESVLFGHVKGAFTGAEKNAEGLIRGADKGTLFLDEIGELPMTIQKAFLRVLQERRFRPVGSSREVQSEFRLISATNRDLDKMVAQGRFRKDLLHRLKTFSINIPPLRDRKEDIQALASHYLDKLCIKHKVPAKGLLPETLAVLTAYDWPGNVRELINALEKAVLSAPELPLIYPMFLPDRIRISHASKDIPRNDETDGQSANSQTILSIPLEADRIPPLKSYREKGVARMERIYLAYLLKTTNHDLDQAAGIAGISKNRLYFLLRKYQMGRA